MSEPSASGLSVWYVLLRVTDVNIRIFTFISTSKFKGCTPARIVIPRQALWIELEFGNVFARVGKWNTRRRISLSKRLRVFSLFESVERSVRALLSVEVKKKGDSTQPSLHGQEPTTNLTHILWHRLRDSDAGHIGWRRLLSTLHHPCFLLYTNKDVFYTDQSILPIINSYYNYEIK